MNSLIGRNIVILYYKDYFWHYLSTELEAAFYVSANFVKCNLPVTEKDPVPEKDYTKWLVFEAIITGKTAYTVYWILSLGLSIIYARLEDLYWLLYLCSWIFSLEYSINSCATTGRRGVLMITSDSGYIKHDLVDNISYWCFQWSLIRWNMDK